MLLIFSFMYLLNVSVGPFRIVSFDYNIWNSVSLLRDPLFKRRISSPAHKKLMSIYRILNAYLHYP